MNHFSMQRIQWMSLWRSNKFLLTLSLVTFYMEGTIRSSLHPDWRYLELKWGSRPPCLGTPMGHHPESHSQKKTTSIKYWLITWLCIHLFCLYLFFFLSFVKLLVEHLDTKFLWASEIFFNCQQKKSYINNNKHNIAYRENKNWNWFND